MGTCLSKKSSQNLPLNRPKTLTLIDQKPLQNPQTHKSVFVIKHQNTENSHSKKPSFDFDKQKGFSDKGKEIVISDKIYENGFSDKKDFEQNSVKNFGENGFSDKNYENGFSDKNYENGFSDKNYENGFSDKNYENGFSDKKCFYENGVKEKGFSDKNYEMGYGEKSLCEISYSDETKKSFGEKSFSDKSFENGFEEVSLADRISRHRRSRSSGTNTRRVSRSPSCRSQSPVSRNNSNSTSLVPSSGNLVPNSGSLVAKSGPGKMVAVPATVGENVVKRVVVRRNVGDPTIVGLSPRTQSPVKRVESISRSNSRREYSPYRRNALGDIDQNCSGDHAYVTYQKTNGENQKSNRLIAQGTYSGPIRSIPTEEYQMKNEYEGSQQLTANIPFRSEGSIPENPKQQTITNRSSKLSRDLEPNQDVHLNPAPSSYTALLLQDIQSFHQKNAPVVSLPPCVNKAQSIMDAVADLNSGTRSNFYAALSDQRRKNSIPVPFNRADDKYGSQTSGDVAEPSFQNYITVTRGTMDIEQEDEEESSGSNSFVSGNQHLVSSSSWEPNSSESTGYCTSSRSNTREDKKTSMSYKGQGHTSSESAEKKKREPEQQRRGIGRYRVGSGRS